MCDVERAFAELDKAIERDLNREADMAELDMEMQEVFASLPEVE